jgi:hypothetical protein
MHDTLARPQVRRGGHGWSRDISGIVDEWIADQVLCFQQLTFFPRDWGERGDQGTTPVCCLVALSGNQPTVCLGSLSFLCAAADLVGPHRTSHAHPYRRSTYTAGDIGTRGQTAITR